LNGLPDWYCVPREVVLEVEWSIVSCKKIVLF
jgi:hypothetical protein